MLVWSGQGKVSVKGLLVQFGNGLVVHREPIWVALARKKEGGWIDFFLEAMVGRPVANFGREGGKTWRLKFDVEERS